MTGEAGGAVPDWLGALSALSVTLVLLGVRAWLSWAGRVHEERPPTRAVLSHRVWRPADETESSGPAPAADAGPVPALRATREPLWSDGKRGRATH